MNRIVRENYPVADLPEDLRSGISGVERVRVVLEPITQAPSGTRPSLDELFAMATPSFADFDEVVAHIDVLRSEWDQSLARLYLDSCVLIVAYGSRGGVAEASRRLLKSVEGRSVAVTSEITLAEVLAPIDRVGATPLERRRAMYMPLLKDSTSIELVPVSRDILLETVAVRSAFSQRLPDAVHIATAKSCDCRLFVSCDRDARRIPSSLNWVMPHGIDIEGFLRSLDV